MFFRSFLLSLACFILPINVSFAANELKDVTLSVATDPSVPPFSYLKGDYMTPEGIDIDIIFEIQKRLGFKLKDNRVFPLTLPDRIQAIKDHKIDIAIGSISSTPERAKFMHFSPVYYHAGISILYSKKFSKEPLNTFADLKLKKVMVLSKSIADELVSNMPKDAMRKITVFTFNDGLLSVANGNVDAFISDRQILEYYAHTLQSLELGVGSEVYAEDLSNIAIATPKKSPYKKYIDMEMQKMINDGTIKKIIDSYKLHK